MSASNQKEGGGCPFHHEESGQAPDPVEYLKALIEQPMFACVFAKAAERKGEVTYYQVEAAMGTPEAAEQVCMYLYEYVEQRGLVDWQPSVDDTFKPFSCVIAFPGTEFGSQEEGGETLTQLLLHMHHFDVSQGHAWAPGVSNDPSHPEFSYSIGGVAFFLPMLYQHAHSGPRQSEVTALVFNAHKVFELLRLKGMFEKGREAIRDRTVQAGHQVAELLADHGDDLEFPQYWLPEPGQVQLLYAWLKQYGGEQPFGEPNTLESK